jgi:hypothetical protein
MLIVLLIISLIIAFIFSLKALADWGFDFGEVILMPLIILIMGIFISFFVSLFGMIIADCSPHVPLDEPPVEVELLALKDGNGVSGTFFLGTGTIDGNLYYHYLEETSKGIQSKKLAAGDNVYLHYTTGNTPPTLKTIKTRPENDFVYFLGSWETDKEYHFYVPHSAVTNEIMIDLE